MKLIDNSKSNSKIYSSILTVMMEFKFGGIVNKYFAYIYEIYCDNVTIIFIYSFTLFASHTHTYESKVLSLVSSLSNS